ncbi:MAG: MFS transporter [Methanomicrobiaceae archaeon]|nr:MFS transporter [Methanomicrobiaceae archaeon]
MKQRLTLLLGVFSVMALSNAIVPVLPAFAEAEVWLQSAIYSAYFFGAFVTVLPAGVLSDRIGRMPLIKTGLLCTFVSGVLIILFPTAIPVFLARLLEGFGGGLFVASALSWVNSRPDHKRLSGYFIGALNLGLVVGLLGTGWLEHSIGITGGVVLFTAVSLVAFLMSLVLNGNHVAPQLHANVPHIVKDYFWLYLSTVVLVGVTGVVTALYPEFTGESAAVLSVQIGTMHTATIVTSLIAPSLVNRPVPTIRIAAIVMGTAVMGSFFAPSTSTIAVFLMFAAIGGLSGFAINAQLVFLAETRLPQGAAMGLFNTSSYAGLALMPFFAGLIAQFAGFWAAFAVNAAVTAGIALTIGRCACRLPVPESP